MVSFIYFISKSLSRIRCIAIKATKNEIVPSEVLNRLPTTKNNIVAIENKMIT